MNGVSQKKEERQRQKHVHCATNGRARNKATVAFANMLEGTVILKGVEMVLGTGAGGKRSGGKR